MILYQTIYEKKFSFPSSPLSSLGYALGVSNVHRVRFRCRLRWGMPFVKVLCKRLLVLM